MSNWRRLTLLTGVAVSVLAANAAMAVDTGKETIELNAQAEYPSIITKKDQKKVPAFPHKKHQEEFLKGMSEFGKFKYTDDYTCKGCHHTTEKGQQPEACLKCKDVNKMLEKVGGADKFENMFHQTCRDGCHKAAEKAGKKAGPTKCAGCHGK